MSATTARSAPPAGIEVARPAAARTPSTFSRPRPSSSWPSWSAAPATAAASCCAARRRAADRGSTPASCPTFCPRRPTSAARDWRIAPVPADLHDRRVEITGPVDRKMVINALNSGAKMYMADFEDSHSPTWEATLEGQVNLRDAVAGTIDYTSPEGKRYPLEQADRHAAGAAARLAPGRKARAGRRPADLGQHLRLRPVLLPQRRRRCSPRAPGPTSTCPSWKATSKRGCGTTCSCWPRTRSACRAGTIKATVLIETILAAFEMDEILYELREHAAGLNCGRWDYIFSFIKKFRNRPDCVLPDRAQVTMTTHFLRSYSRLLIKTCHRRGAHAMGGMAAQIPIKNDPAANEQALAKVRADKEREASDGHDGTWVAHPGLVPVALEVFDAHMSGPNQLEPPRSGRARHGRRPAARARGPDHARGAAHQRHRRRAVSRVLAARQRLRADLQPDGRRRHGRDLAGADLAVDSPPARALRRRHARSRRCWSSRCWPTSWPACASSWAPRPMPPASSTRPANCS